jgi:hypothetical protein
LIGETSCGCAGRRLTVSPWVAFAVDVLVVGLLLVGRPDLTPLRENTCRTLAKQSVPLACALAGLAILGVGLVTTARMTVGSVPAALAHLRGDRVSVVPNVAEVEQGTAGERRQVKVEVVNWTDGPIRVIGGTSDCSCTVLGDLPVEIPPRESRSALVDISLKGGPGIFTRKADFLIDDHGLKRISFSVTGRILKSDTDFNIVSGTQ